MTGIDLDRTTGVVPVFPLPDMALLPGELMPLYIFEPRYRRMLADALAGDRLIAMARFEPGWEPDYHLNPDVKKVMGLGSIVSHTEQDAGAAEIVLKGVARVSLLEVVRELPYRLARIDAMPEVVSDPMRLRRLVAEVVALLDPLCRQHDHPFGGDGYANLPLDELPGRLVPLLQYDPDTKHALLECDDLVGRMEIVLQRLKARARVVRTDKVARHWPAPPSPTLN